MYYEDDRDFRCDTSQVGCAQICYNSFNPIGQDRFRVIEVVLISVPWLVFYGYAMSINNKLKKFEHQRKRLKFFEKVKQFKIKELKAQWRNDNNGVRKRGGSYKDLWHSAKDKINDKKNGKYTLNVDRSPPPINAGSLTEEETTIGSSTRFGSKRRMSFDYAGTHFDHEKLGKINDPDTEILDSKKNMKKYRKYLGSLADGISSDEDIETLLDGGVNKKDKYSFAFA